MVEDDRCWHELAAIEGSDGGHRILKTVLTWTGAVPRQMAEGA
jgi:hypothetical protein